MHSKLLLLVRPKRSVAEQVPEPSTADNADSDSGAGGRLNESVNRGDQAPSSDDESVTSPNRSVKKSRIKRSLPSDSDDRSVNLRSAESAVKATSLML